MLDPNRIRKAPEEIKNGLSHRGLPAGIVDDFLLIDEAWRKTTAEMDELRKKQNDLSKEKKIEEAKKNKSAIKEKEDELLALGKRRASLLDQLPNIPLPSAQVGKKEEDNKVLREVGERTTFDFAPKDHLELGTKLGIIDTERASATTGTRFTYLFGDAVLLEFALVQFALEKLVGKEFIPVLPPAMIRPEVYAGMGRLAGDQKEERYYFEKDGVYLIGSAEHTIGPIHMNEILNVNNLPRRYVGFSTNFRREAGSYGKDTKGILRMHQFDKIEMFSFTTPEKSEEEHEFLLSIQEEMMKELELPYRVVEICTGDMGWTDARQFDVETWMPGQNQYRETNSCSNTTDFQSRGINAKYRTTDGKTEYLHTLNATGIVMSRIPAAIFENYQTKEGNIRIPKVLQKYVGKEEITRTESDRKA